MIHSASDLHLILIHGGFGHQYLLKALIASITTLLSIFFYYKRAEKTSSEFRNEEGRMMEEVRTNSRFRRFAHGSELSEEGYEKAHGDPYIVWNGRKREIVLSSPAHTRDFYQGDAKDHVKPRALNMGHYFDRILGSSAGVQNGEQWNTTRRHFDPSFSHASAMDFRTIFSEEVKKWLENLSNAQAASLSSFGEFDIDAVEACKVLPFKLVAYACYGNALLADSVLQELLALNTVHEQLMGQAIFGKVTESTVYGMLPTQHKRRMDQFQKDWAAFNMKMIQKAQETGETCPIARIYANVHPNGTMTKQEFFQTIDEILFTNVDVTSTVLAFLLINLAATAPIQDQLRTEIQSWRSSESFEGYLAKSGTLLEHTCIESTRLCPATWFSLPEYSPNPKRIAGFLIPPSTPIIIDWKRLNTQSPIWNPEPIPGQKEPITGLTFNPNRFDSLSPSQYRYSFLRYGIGPRKCIGKNFAALIMKTMLVEVLSSYRLEIDARDKGRVEQRAFELRDDRFTITPKQVVRFVKIT
ncbi:hypothetical protein MMC17_004606 [Xylographa soralifera]|nr:hypothetical protein [Xylographa soralifera]